MRRAIVLFQADDLRFGKIFFELENVSNIRPAPGVDGLVFIADGAHVVPGTSQRPHEFILRAVGVLIFINQNVLKSLVVILANVRGRFQQAHSFKQQVVEVQRVRSAQFFAVLLINMCDALGLRIGGIEIDLLRIEHVVLRPGDMRKHVARGQFLVINSQALHHRFRDLLLVRLVVDDETLRVSNGRLAWNSGRNAQGFDVPPQHPHTERMERGNDRLRDRHAANNLLDALAHFCRSFIGECDGEDGFRHHAQVFDQVRDPIGDDTSFPATRASQNQHRPFGRFHRFALLGIEL